MIVRNIYRYALIAAATTAGMAQASTATDAAVTAKVKTALIAEPSTKARQIEVETRDGIVQLSGFVDSTTEKQTAIRVASSIKGVSEVHDKLEIKASTRNASELIDDATVTARVKAALIDNPVTKARAIQVETRNGEVQLSGFVGSDSEKTEAGKAALGVKGAQAVINNLELKPGT